MESQYGSKRTGRCVYRITPEEALELSELPHVLEMHPTSLNPVVLHTENNTLYDVVRYIRHITGKKLEHNKLLKKIRSYPTDIFGEVTEHDVPAMRSTITATAQLVEAPIHTTVHTVKLTPRQCILVATMFSMPIQLAVIDQLHYLESKYEPSMVTQTDECYSMMSNLESLTLYGVCRYVKAVTGKNIRHNDIMRRRMHKWLALQSFGNAQMIDVQVPTTNGGSITVRTYALTPRQCLAIAGTQSLLIQVRIVDRLHSLETTYVSGTPTTRDALAAAIAIYRDYVDNGVVPDGVTGPGVIIERLNKEGHIFYYKPGCYILNPLSDHASLCIE